METSGLDPIDCFVRIYSRTLFSKALEIAQDNPPVSLFYERLEECLVDEFLIDHRLFVHLHRPYHWILFCERNGSPLEYVQPRENNKVPFITLKNNKGGEEVLDHLVELFIKKYGDFFKERLRHYR